MSGGGGSFTPKFAPGFSGGDMPTAPTAPTAPNAPQFFGGGYSPFGGGYGYPSGGGYSPFGGGYMSNMHAATNAYNQFGPQMQDFGRARGQYAADYNQYVADVNAYNQRVDDYATTYGRSQGYSAPARLTATPNYYGGFYPQQPYQPYQTPQSYNTGNPIADFLANSLMSAGVLNRSP